jgi:hypothetical protein
MRFDEPMYLVIVHHPTGDYIPEPDVVLTGLKEVCKDLRDGQYENVVAVLECNVRDATHAFKDFFPTD